MSLSHKPVLRLWEPPVAMALCRWQLRMPHYCWLRVPEGWYGATMIGEWLPFLILV